MAPGFQLLAAPLPDGLVVSVFPVERPMSCLRVVAVGALIANALVRVGLRSADE
jgi:hypothetical protein